MRAAPGRLAAWSVATLLAAMGAGPPEVVQVRVPSSKISSWFPPGSDLQVLPYDRFEALRQAARGRPIPPPTPRLLKARHSARWGSGRLLGRTELTVEASSGEARGGLLILEPWSPAAALGMAGSKDLRATPDGRLALKVAPDGPRTIGFDWTQGPRPGSLGRAFALDLPAADLSSLSLDLPAGMVPEASAGPRFGPEAGATPGRSAWRFEAARGKLDLRLRLPPTDARGADAPRLWLEGTTSIDLGALPTNWRADWTLDEAPGSPRGLAIGLDPGLEAVEVSGPRVASFRVVPESPGSRVEIMLGGEGSGTSALTIRGFCRVPEEGTWSVPSASPRDATWTGGRTLVRLDSARVLQSCRERSGRRVPPRPGEPAAPSGLAFEPRGGPGPVADLTFREPVADATVEVRGHLRLGDDAPRLDVALTWTIEKGRCLSFAADLPPGWTTDGVASSTGEPVPWHAEPLGNGGTIVHFSPSSVDETSRSVSLTLSASASRAGVTGPLDLPRVRPAPGARVVDELWIATHDPALAVKPTLASGLAWLDPPDPTLDGVPAPWLAADLPGALAWRWVSEGAEARIDRAQAKAEPRGEVGLRASIRAGRLALEWTIRVESPRGDPGPIPIHLDGPVGGPIAWRAGEAGGPTIEPRPMEADRRAALGFPATGQAWDLPWPGPAIGEILVSGRTEGAWAGRGRIPILTLPDRSRMRGTVTLRVEDSTRVKFDQAGLTPFDAPTPGIVPAAEPEGADLPPDSRMRVAGAFGYRSGGVRLSVETTDPPAGSTGGFIREASLASQVSPGSGIRHRLNLGIAADSGRPLALRMPRGVAIDRLKLDGQPVVPVRSGDEVLVAIPPPGASKPLCSLTIEYRTDDPRSGPIEPGRLLPWCSLPCLGFAWEVVAPGGWDAGAIARGLEATDPRPVPSVAARLLGFHWSPWGDREPEPAAKAGRESLADLDRAAADVADGETNLGDWLLKLDAGRRPLVVDRLAVRSVGVGPGTRIDASLPGTTKASGPVRSILDPLGLAAVPLGGVVLITAEGEAPAGRDDRDAWEAAVRSVPSEDSDRTDRFQSATRWRGEATPRAPASGESPAPPAARGDWRRRRFVSGGWPAPGASVTLVDARSDRARGWLIASIVLLAGILARRQPPRARALGLAAIGLLGTLGVAWHWPEASATSTGLVRGGLGVLAFWIGRSIRPSPAPAPTNLAEAATSIRRIGLAAGSLPLLVLCAAIGLGLGAVAAGPEADAPILALLPFDGPADPQAKPDRAVLLVRDFERLEKLARPDDARADAGAWIVSASHKVGREAPGLAVVESVYEVEVEGPGPASWTFPVGREIELLAEVDARPSPLAISPDGSSATLTLEGAGVHRLRFRRLAPLSAIGRGGEGARVPINRAAFARVAVSRGGVASWVDVAGAAGELAVEGGGIAGGLGPLDTLEVRWYAEDHAPSLEFCGPVEANFLWDARAEGDLIRMRLTHSDPEGVSAVRIAMGRGLVVRRHAIPGIVSVRLEGTEGRPEWVAQVDPPLPKDAPIEVDFWRIAPGAEGRRWPEIDVPSASKVSGLIGFRRPSDWSGRLEPKGGVEPASEAVFARAWGTFPDDGLTLSGAAKFARSTGLDVATKPVPSRRSVQTKVVVRPAPGRLNASIEGVLADRQGRSFDLEVAIPLDLRVIRVEADGLLDWRRVARDRLRLQFDGSERFRRTIRLEAYVPAPADSVMSETRAYRVKVPWPRWGDAEQAPGTIEVAGPTRTRFDPGEGTSAIPPAGTAGVDATPPTSYRVEGAAGPSTIGWSAPAAKVGVAVDSELAVDSTTLTWTAELTCEVSGGPANSLSLNLPTEWAEGASIEVEGQSHRLASSPSTIPGMTQWSIVPDAPLWGVARLILRSRRPLRFGREFAFPQVAPLATPGRGSLGRYDLAIRNRSGRPMEIAGSSGLQPVDASRFRGVDSASTALPPGPIDHAYQLTGGPWSLRLRVGRADDEALAPGASGVARVGFAALDVARNPDDSTWGRARFDLEPRPAPFLAVGLPEGAAIARASVEGRVVPAFRDGPGPWLIPLGDGRPRRVELAWHRPGSPDGTGSLALPTLDPPARSCLISAEGPDDRDIALVGDSAARIGRAGWEEAQVERLAGRLVEALGSLDRSSRRDREAIVDDLAEIELRVRHVSSLGVGRGAPADLATGRLQASLDAIAEASQAAGLDELIQEARARVGVAQADEDAAEVFATSAPEVVRLRRSGSTHLYRTNPGRGQRGPTITSAEAAPGPRRGSAGSWWVAVAGLLSWMAIGGLIARDARRPGRIVASLLLLALVGLLAWEPAGFVAASALLAWGRQSA